MVLRVAGYGLDLEEAYPGHEIHHFVLYFGLQHLQMPDKLESRSGALRFQCTILDIRDFSGRDLLASDSLSDNFLALLTSDVDQRQVIRQVLTKLKDVPEKQRGDHLIQLLILSGLRRLEPVLTEEARSIMPIVVDLMENSIIRDIVNQATAEASAQARGEARIQAKREDLTAMLHHRFAELPEWVETKLQSAELGDLNRWIVRMSDAPATIEDALS
jgi:hypothetical protein